MSSPFDRHGQSSLVPGTIPRDAPGHDFAPIGHELAQQSLVLVINLVHSVFAETTGFLFPSLELNHIDVVLPFFRFGLSEMCDPVRPVSPLVVGSKNLAGPGKPEPYFCSKSNAQRFYSRETALTPTGVRFRLSRSCALHLCCRIFRDAPGHAAGSILVSSRG